VSGAKDQRFVAQVEQDSGTDGLQRAR